MGKKIIEEFEKIGMVKALKESKDFNGMQYKLMLRLFQEILAEQQEDIKSVIGFLEGDCPREKVVNYIKEYLYEK